jgi:hypothetical protein
MQRPLHLQVCGLLRFRTIPPNERGQRMKMRGNGKGGLLDNTIPVAKIAAASAAFEALNGHCRENSIQQTLVVGDAYVLPAAVRAARLRMRCRLLCLANRGLRGFLGI